MKKILTIAIALTSFLAACKKSENTPEPAPGKDLDMTQPLIERTVNNGEYREPQNNILTGDIKENTILKSGKTYTLKGFVYVLNGATLKMEPGVTVLGEKASKASLIITRNGKIEAKGTASSPIVFTSDQPVPAIGDWGGLIILGNARTNGSFNGIAGLQEIEGGVNDSRGTGLHGGTNDNDNSGVLQYVRVEYPGIAFEPNNEINGITFGSVGRGTQVDYVQVAYSGDDGFEWFGGTVNCSHLISYRNTDDDFDSDNGYSGKVQFAISVRDPFTADFATGGSSNGLESDNDAGGTSSQPKTAAVFSNVTLIGPWAQTGNPASPFKRGAHIRKNSAISLFNSVIVGWKTGILIDGKSTAENVSSGLLEVKNVLIAGAGKAIDSAASGQNFDPVGWFNGHSGNRIKNDNSEAMLMSLDLANLNPAPGGGSPALSGADFSNSKLSGLKPTSFIGAAGQNDIWWNNWAKF